jgi:predicted DNA-binding protein with PD1-like motif
MKAKLIHDGPQKTWAVIFDSGDEVVAGLTKFVSDENVTAGQITAIGAFAEATLGYFDLEKKEYERISVREQVEVLALIGDVALADGQPKLHLHVVVGRRNGGAMGGHLLDARVRPTLEVILTESPAHLRRRHDPATGLPLIDASL